MAMDQNPALPNMAYGEHYSQLVHATVYSRSHRKNQTIGGMLVHNKYRAALVEVLVINLSNIVVDHEKEGDIYITIKNYIISRWI